MASYTGTDKRLQFLFDMVSNFAPDYDNTKTYAVGAYAIYMGVLYKCIIAVTVAEDFDDTKWTRVLAMNEIGSGSGSTVSINPTLSSGTKIADFSINGNTGELYAPSGGGGGGETVSFGHYVPSISATSFVAVGSKYVAQNTGFVNIRVRVSASRRENSFYVLNNTNGTFHAVSWYYNGNDNSMMIPVNAGDELEVSYNANIAQAVIEEIPISIV